MIKADESVLPGSTFNKAGDQEPIFVLRAQDLLAPAVVRVWAALARTHNVRAAKIVEAQKLALDMEGWQAVNLCKKPD